MSILRDHNGTDHQINGDTLSIGRDPKNKIPLPEYNAVSRFHSEVFAEDGKFFVQDVGSRNGTTLNDRLLPAKVPTPLKNGDKIRVCDLEFTFLTDQVFAPVFYDEEDSDSGNSTIMSKLGMSSRGSGVQLTASPQAKLDALQEIAQSLGKALSLDEVLPKVLRSLFQIFMQADRGFIALKEDGKLVPRWSETRRDDGTDAIRISRTIVNQVMESQEAILSADAANDGRFEMSESIADFRIRSMMCAPLVDSDNRSMGVIQIDTLDQRQRFQSEDLEVLLAVAAQAGIAIDNAKMHEKALRVAAVERDLELATEVQRGFLPNQRPEIDGYRFFDYYKAANHVGGDYYDYVHLPDGRLAVIVADVVGHGVAAALLMAKLSAEVRYCLASEATPAEAIERLNNRMSNLQIDRFVTLVMTVLDPESGKVVICNAGHMAPIHLKKDGSIDEPGEAQSGLPVGILEDATYEQAELQLEVGETLTLYTDGLNEAANKEGEEFQISRIKDIVRREGADPERSGNAVVREVMNFVGNEDQADDMCLVSFGRF